MMKKDVLVKALQLAKEAVLRFDHKNVKTETKQNAGDLLTAADLASEKVIIDTIKQIFPDDVVMSEESSDYKKMLQQGTASFTGWVTDPIDGTNNFKRGFNYSAISLAYVDKGEVLLGGVLNPYNGDTYIAEKHRGATLNGQNISVGNAKAFDMGTRVCTCNTYEENDNRNIRMLLNLGKTWFDVQGSAVLAMCDAACGKFDLFFHDGLKPWDNAAAFLIAKEAGAKIVGLDGQAVDWTSPEILVGNADLVGLFVSKNKP